MTRMRILITRPQPAADQWQASLAARGWQADIVSCMAIEALTDRTAAQAIKNQVLAFDEFHKVIFVSRNAVAYTLNWLDEYWPQLPVGIEYFAIGESTAQALRDADITPQVLGGVGSPMNSETLLASAGLQRVEGERILLCKGEGGRDLIERTLSARGAKVNACPLYRRRIPDQAANQLRWWLLDCAPDDAVITVHSGESLENLVAVANAVDALKKLQAQPLVVPGERVAAIAQKLCFDPVVTALNASDEAMQKALETLVK
ncbi:uroporphyrinogen-III synthase [Gilvimarinus sp. SDUM040013]|uniref:Uroporphyrinogen-III synthase n=1 Tax=Gilvimarinus gilvus TaxID=3058038 RepID=A0ABU4S3D3_9GAMM|nr:uroporphyrinogen-III synthase [Gilvimarinus sp. SDUM040013]MDO3384407.1 uroporphyrinogen-III synthase [Gilvimarinus sp. SDUM040013]MDX6851012.1 uroporphyrinogen-III synthase [Gilvimarinus sp. SDUM040013]